MQLLSKIIDLCFCCFMLLIVSLFFFLYLLFKILLFLSWNLAFPFGIDQVSNLFISEVTHLGFYYIEVFIFKELISSWRSFRHHHIVYLILNLLHLPLLLLSKLPALCFIVVSVKVRWLRFFLSILVPPSTFIFFYMRRIVSILRSLFWSESKVWIPIESFAVTLELCVLELVGVLVSLRGMNRLLICAILSMVWLFLVHTSLISRFHQNLLLYLKLKILIIICWFLFPYEYFISLILIN